MKKQKVQDERMAAQRRKMNSEAFGILMLVLLGSTLVQEFLLHASFEQYDVEVICFFGMSVYMIVRNMTLGIDIYGDGKRAKIVPFINCMAVAIVVTAIVGVQSYSRSEEHYKDNMGFFIAALAITFISAAVIALAGVTCVRYLNKKRQAQVRKRLDEDEQDDTANK